MSLLGAHVSRYVFSRCASYYVLSTGNGLNGRHSGMAFSTKDRDLDASPTKNCAITKHGGYWYGSCNVSNLNGKYHLSPADDSSMGFYWLGTVSSSQMKFRRK